MSGHDAEQLTASLQVILRDGSHRAIDGHPTADMACEQMARVGQSTGGKAPEITRFGG
mgnify:CR=1 FL=1